MDRAYRSPVRRSAGIRALAAGRLGRSAGHRSRRRRLGVVSGVAHGGLARPPVPAPDRLSRPLTLTAGRYGGTAVGKFVALAALLGPGRGGGSGPGGGGGGRRRGSAGSTSVPGGTGAVGDPGSGGDQPGPAVPAGLAPPLPAGRRHLSGPLLVGPGRRRHRRERERPFDRARGVVREPTPPGPRARCSSSRPPSPPTPPSGPAGPGPRPRTIRWTRSTRASALLCADGGGSAGDAARRHRRLQPLRHLRGHRADPGPGLRRRTPRYRARWSTPSPSPPDSSARPTCGEGPAPVGSTARAWPRPPTATRASPSRGWPRTSSTPDRPSPAARPSQPGDLVFFGTGASGVDHVGLYVGAGEMIDAPHTGALVRFDDADWPGLVGATRPG